MSSLVLEIRRVPKAGKFFEVIDAMRKAMSETERIGMVTATATSSHLFNKDVVTTSRLNNIDELELIEDNVFTSSDFQKKASSIEELCSKTTTIQVLNMIFYVKYCNENICFVSKQKNMFPQYHLHV